MVGVSKTNKTPPQVSRVVRVLHIEAVWQGEHLQISAQESLRGEEKTIRHYEEIQVSLPKVKARCQELVDTLNRANRRGQIFPDLLAMLQEKGQVLYDELFPPSVKEKLNQTQADYLQLSLDEHLVQVPWELLYDGRQFLCLRFKMGRSVKTRQRLMAIRNREPGFPLKILILADPEGDLKGACTEGTLLQEHMDLNSDLIQAALCSDNLTLDWVREKIRNFDIVHFAGHADYNLNNPAESQWRLGRHGHLKASDIQKMAATGLMPALIFSNACQSARTEEWVLTEHFHDEIFGLANAFLLTGVKHYLGTFWEIQDEPGSQFSLPFYTHLLAGDSIGEAVQKARQAMINLFGKESMAWASYVLYGDPTSPYLDKAADRLGFAQKEQSQPGSREDENKTGERFRGEEQGKERGKERGKEQGQKIEIGKVKAGDQKEVNNRLTKLPRPKLLSLPGIILIIATAATSILLVYLMLGRSKTRAYEQKALAAYKLGHYSEAAEACRFLQKNKPEGALGLIILGQISFLEGDRVKARQYFQQAHKAKQAAAAEKAEASLGLGRLASIENKIDQAMEWYQHAARLTPKNRQVYLSQALLMDKIEKYDEAEKLFAQAKALGPEDPAIEAMAKKTRDQALWLKDKEKQQRIDQLVNELLNNFHQSPSPPPSDGWTASPLTIWVMDFTCLGYSWQEGLERLIASSLNNLLLEKSRVQLVERSILDKVMGELKMGNSRLADQGTALALGRIMAARLILCGQIIYTGTHTQVTYRLIETETSQVKAVVNESFTNPILPSLVADRLATRLLDKIKVLYPLRGKIAAVREKELTLNIGQRHGVRLGQQFKVVGTDQIIVTVAVQPDQSIARLNKGEKHPARLENIRAENLRAENLNAENLNAENLLIEAIN